MTGQAIGIFHSSPTEMGRKSVLSSGKLNVHRQLPFACAMNHGKKP